VKPRESSISWEALEANVERPRRVDSYIDYFGSGEALCGRISSDPCGESLLDGDGAR
jgi:hypothetical protein